jgi:hypothetical protein
VLRTRVGILLPLLDSFNSLPSGLEHATIKDNIIFGSPAPYDEERYRLVLHACALEPDLDILAAGDMTGGFYLACK